MRRGEEEMALYKAMRRRKSREIRNLEERNVAPVNLGTSI